jgi:hypothetical protein
MINRQRGDLQRLATDSQPKQKKKTKKVKKPGRLEYIDLENTAQQDELNRDAKSGEYAM